MTRKPIVFDTRHRIKFADLDPYNHLGTALYSAYFINHRMEGLRERLGWDIKGLEKLPFMAWVRRIEIDFIKPVFGDMEIRITSQVREFRGPDVDVECIMADVNGKVLSRCVMIVACVSKETNRAIDWPAEAVAKFYEPE